MTHTIDELQLIEQRVTNDGPNIAAAYLLWFFLGVVSAHRFYLRRPISAVLQILSYVVVVGIIWWAIDLILIPGMIKNRQNEIRRRVSESLVRG